MPDADPRFSAGALERARRSDRGSLIDHRTRLNASRLFLQKRARPVDQAESLGRSVDFGQRRMLEVRTVTTMTAALLGLGDWLAELGVTRVLMEATSDYWRAPFYLLEDRFQTWLVNAKDVRHLPGRHLLSDSILGSGNRSQTTDLSAG